MWRHRFRRTTLWLMLFAGILAGIGLSRAWGHSAAIACLITAPFVLISIRQRRLAAVICVVLFGVSVGWWRGSAYGQQLARYPLRRTVTVTATALGDGLYDDHKQMSFEAGDIEIDGQELPGKIQLSGFGLNAVFAGDRLTATGKLYRGYGAYAGRMSFARLELVEHRPSIIGLIRSRFGAGLQTALPEPVAPFALGILIGQRATLPDETKEDLLKVGLTHIIAVSGYNLTIILRACQKGLGRRSKRISTFLTLGLILVFLLLTGASASIVRAAIVSMLSIWAAYYGRSFRPLNLITLAAAITALVNPVYEWRDLSWYLSFLAFFGVMVLSPLLQVRLPGSWHRSLIGGVALESVCAEIMSLPFILHMFGQMSFVGLPANVLITTLVPLAMLLSLFAGLAGMFMAPLAGWIAWPAEILMRYMLDTAHILAGLPHVFVDKRSLSLAAMLGLYGLVAGFVTVLWRVTNRPESATITDKNVRSQQMVND